MYQRQTPSAHPQDDNFSVSNPPPHATFANGYEDWTQVMGTPASPDNWQNAPSVTLSPQQVAGPDNYSPDNVYGYGMQHSSNMNYMDIAASSSMVLESNGPDTLDVTSIPVNLWTKLSRNESFLYHSQGAKLIESRPSSIDERVWELIYLIDNGTHRPCRRLFLICNDQSHPNCTGIEHSGSKMKRHFESASHVRLAGRSGVQCPYCGWHSKTERQDTLQRHWKESKLCRNVCIRGANSGNEK